MILKDAFLNQLKTTFPGLQNTLGDDLVSENLLSPFTVELPEKIRQQAQEIIQSIFAMRELPQYQEHYKSLAESKGLHDRATSPS